MVGAVAGLYYGAGRAGLHLAYLHGSVTALWPPVGVGVAALVILGPGVWPGIVIGDLLLADFSSPLARPQARRSGTRSRSSSRRCCSAGSHTTASRWSAFGTFLRSLRALLSGR